MYPDELPHAPLDLQGSISETFALNFVTSGTATVRSTSRVHRILVWQAAQATRHDSPTETSGRASYAINLRREPLVVL